MRLAVKLMPSVAMNLVHTVGIASVEDFLEGLMFTLKDGRKLAYECHKVEYNRGGYDYMDYDVFWTMDSMPTGNPK
jgi:hypothetical protein